MFSVQIQQRNKIIEQLILSADDQILLQKTEDNLQIAIYRLNQICKKNNLKISEKKTKVMAFI